MRVCVCTRMREGSLRALQHLRRTDDCDSRLMHRLASSTDDVPHYLGAVAVWGRAAHRQHISCHFDGFGLVFGALRHAVCRYGPTFFWKSLALAIHSVSGIADSDSGQDPRFRS